MASWSGVGDNSFFFWCLVSYYCGLFLWGVCKNVSPSLCMAATMFLMIGGVPRRFSMYNLLARAACVWSFFRMGSLMWFSSFLVCFVTMCFVSGVHMALMDINWVLLRGVS